VVARVTGRHQVGGRLARPTSLHQRTSISVASFRRLVTSKDWTNTAGARPVQPGAAQPRSSSGSSGSPIEAW